MILNMLTDCQSKCKDKLDKRPGLLWPGGVAIMKLKEAKGGSK